MLIRFRGPQTLSHTWKEKDCSHSLIEPNSSKECIDLYSIKENHFEIQVYSKAKKKKKNQVYSNALAMDAIQEGVNIICAYINPSL